MKVHSVVVMGVAGCGKSSLAHALAQAEGAVLVEGDSHHSAASREKMQRGVPLSDADREGWLASLADELRRRPAGTVMACSALKRAYRDRLRAAAPGLAFVHLDIDRETARLRIEGRGGSHFFSPALVDSQFATLEPPQGESGVLALDARLPLDELLRRARAWLRLEEHRS